jgi:hypothetical protein
MNRQINQQELLVTVLTGIDKRSISKSDVKPQVYHKNLRVCDDL